ncbi:hypothetical protein D3C77_789160 [compost metagenome]
MRRIWNTESVMPPDYSRSKVGFEITSSCVNKMSRRTENRCSCMPLIILPSTKALAGAFLISSLMPRSR